jgi:hypothetical protein
MNERIQELAEQARKYAREYVADCKHYGHYMEHNELEVKFEEKFAELIVRECVAICEDTAGEHIADARWGRRCCALEIKQHFGVEEC